MPQSGYIVASILRGPLAQFAAMGGDVAGLRHLRGLQDRSATGTVALRGFVGVFQDAACALRAPRFGWVAGEGFALADLGEMGTAIEAAPTLGAALTTFCGAFAAVQGDSMLCLDLAGDEARLRYRILDPRIWPRDQDAEFTLSILLRLVRAAAGPGWRPHAVSFEHGPHAGRAATEAALGVAPHHGGDWNALHFPASLLDRPMPRGDADRHRDLKRSLTEAAAARVQGLPVARRVRQEILSRLGEPGLGEAVIAQALGRSERTLRRQLAAEGTGFAALMADCRGDMARHLLAHTGLDREEIALRLGYSDAATFGRAFQRLTGRTPAQLRRQAAGTMPCEP